MTYDPIIAVEPGQLSIINTRFFDVVPYQHAIVHRLEHYYYLTVVLSDHSASTWALQHLHVAGVSPDDTAAYITTRLPIINEHLAQHSREVFGNPITHFFAPNPEQLHINVELGVTAPRISDIRATLEEHAEHISAGAINQLVRQTIPAWLMDYDQHPPRHQRVEHDTKAHVNHTVHCIRQKLGSTSLVHTLEAQLYQSLGAIALFDNDDRRLLFRAFDTWLTRYTLDVTQGYHLSASSTFRQQCADILTGHEPSASDRMAIEDFVAITRLHTALRDDFPTLSIDDGSVTVIVNAAPNETITLRLSDDIRDALRNYYNKHRKTTHD